MRASKKRRTSALAKATRKPARQGLRTAAKGVKKAVAKVARKLGGKVVSKSAARKGAKPMAKMVNKMVKTIVAGRPAAAARTSARAIGSSNSRTGAKLDAAANPRAATKAEEPRSLKLRAKAVVTPRESQVPKKQDSAQDRAIGAAQVVARAASIPLTAPAAQVVASSLPRARSFTPREASQSGQARQAKLEQLPASHQSVSGPSPLFGQPSPRSAEVQPAAAPAGDEAGARPALPVPIASFTI